jgi:hypothetical protein
VVVGHHYGSRKVDDDSLAHVRKTRPLLMAFLQHLIT